MEETLILKEQKGSIRQWLKKEKLEMEILFRSIPVTVVSLFVVSVICMNLLANKTIVQTDLIALDGGILISWLSFLCMDIITKYFGPKASTKVAILASAINVLTFLLFYIASIIPSKAADYTAFNSIFGGTWFILLGSTIAFLLSAVVNNIFNFIIGNLFKKNPDGKLVIATRTYVSTLIGQFVDNLIFALIVFVGFAPIFWDGFHWTIVQCITCSMTGAIAELILEIVFSPIAYNTVKKWKKSNIGREYLELRNRD